MFRPYILTIIREKNTSIEGKVPAEEASHLQSIGCKIKIEDEPIEFMLCLYRLYLLVVLGIT
jgi:hypothetical protein